MITPSTPHSVLTENAAGIGTATREMVRERAAELAVINGRGAQEPSKADWDEAERELTGAPEIDPKTTILESAPEAARWDPIPSSSGEKAPEIPDDEVDEDGQSQSARLFEHGAREAEHDRMLKGATVEPREED
jgi:hypothetical protein